MMALQSHIVRQIVFRLYCLDGWRESRCGWKGNWAKNGTGSLCVLLLSVRSPVRPIENWCAVRGSKYSVQHLKIDIERLCYLKLSQEYLTQRNANHFGPQTSKWKQEWKWLINSLRIHSQSLWKQCSMRREQPHKIIFFSIPSNPA